MPTPSWANLANAQVGAPPRPAFCFAHARNSLCLEKDSGTPQPILNPATSSLTAGTRGRDHSGRCLLREDKSLELPPDLPYSLGQRFTPEEVPNLPDL